ncbi:MAG TPA: 3-hydroxyacyl-CoA dehydrogenase NAD-binding domain-containing protein [Solirubrobacteraceae bacterium]|nr:3-hydroxyacyl-CoA dehydrogenase NAD-binding domain-containing protein [Solirubrobacteraceae bacterium]
MERPAASVAVVGAGTMGSGIAQLAARSGAATLLFDPLDAALETGLERARDGLEREARRGRITAEQAAAAAGRLAPAAALEDFKDCELVIEAIPERLELKHELFAALSPIVGAGCVLATNTSSLPVTAVAAGAQRPERVVGMHFFNPAPVMALVEVIAGVLSAPAALELVDATGRAMGKTVIRAADGPGFLVNRCNRPFGLEGLRLLAERVADVETIDRVCRLGGGFPMGPFELMDLVGVDTGLAVSESFYELSFGEPRWRPSPITARQVAAGLLGRKSGRGYYTYTKGDDGKLRYRDEDTESAPAPSTPEGDVVIAGETPLARELAQAARAAGYEVHGADEVASAGVLPALSIDCRPVRTPGPAPAGGARLMLCAGAPLAMLDRGGAVGFHALPPFDGVRVVEMTRRADSSPLAAARAERFFASLGRRVQWVGDAPGLVLGRIVCQLINEAAFALGEGVGSAADIDLGMRLGLAHPRGPFEWAQAIGLEHVLAVLDGLWALSREERYRAAPLLRTAAESGVPLHD